MKGHKWEATPTSWKEARPLSVWIEMVLKPRALFFIISISFFSADQLAAITAIPLDEVQHSPFGQPTSLRIQQIGFSALSVCETLLSPFRLSQTNVDNYYNLKHCGSTITSSRPGHKRQPSNRFLYLPYQLTSRANDKLRKFVLSIRTTRPPRNERELNRGVSGRQGEFPWIWCNFTLILYKIICGRCVPLLINGPPQAKPNPV